MKAPLKSIRGALGTAVLWAFMGAWFGLLMEGFDPHGTYVDIWVGALGIPGFFDGLALFTLLRVAEGVTSRRRWPDW